MPIDTHDDADMAADAAALIADRPVLANARMGQGCPAPLCMADGALVTGITLRGPFDRDQIRIGGTAPSARIGTAEGVGISIEGPLLLTVPERRP